MCGHVFWCSGMVLFCAFAITFIAGLGWLFTPIPAPAIVPVVPVVPPTNDSGDPPPVLPFLSPRQFLSIELDATNVSMLATGREGACENLYAASCGYFTSDKYAAYDQLMNRVQTTNDRTAALISKWIEIGDTGQLSAAGGNGHAMVKFYRECVATRITESHWIDTHTELLIDALRKTPGDLYDKLRFMREKGLLSYVQITKDRDRDANFFHYIRPGGVLSYNEMELDLAPLFGGVAPTRSMATNMTVAEFLTRAGSQNWRKVLGPDTKLYDTAIVENIEYFVNLANLIRTSPAKVMARLEVFVTQTTAHLNKMSCLDKTFLMYPMTTCNLFRKNSLGHDDDNPDVVLDTLADDVLKIVKEMFFAEETAKLRVQRCSSIFHSDNIGQIILTKEMQRAEINLANETHVGWMIDTLAHLAEYYNPVYLYYSYPRVLDSNDYYLDDPLRWWSQTNAWYDWFRDLVVIPIGFSIFPLWRESFPLERKIQMAFIVGHEFVHTYQDKDQAPLVCCSKYLSAERCSTDRRFEMHSDVVGLQIAWQYYLRKNPVVSTSRIQEAFMYFGQMFCSLKPSVDPDGIHGSPIERVNIPWRELQVANYKECKQAPQC